MPGVYSESIEMKPYVDVVGSGYENTKITSNANFTVVSNDNSTIENIWIDNLSPTYGFGAIWNDGVSTTINKVKVTTAVAQLNGMQSYGLYNTRGAKVTVSNSDIIVTSSGSGARGAIGIWVEGGSDVSISNCRITVDSTASSYSMWNAGIYNQGNLEGKVTVRDSVIRVVGANYNRGFDGRGPLRVSNTRVEAIATANTLTNDAVLAFDTNTDYNVINSEIIASGNTSGTNCAINNGKYGSSLISGPRCGTPKIVNSWDENFNPIPNQ